MHWEQIDYQHFPVQIHFEKKIALLPQGHLPMDVNGNYSAKIVQSTKHASTDT